MARPVQFEVVLTKEEKAHLNKLRSSGKQGARAIKRAMILLRADKSENTPMEDEQIAHEVGCCVSTVVNVKLRFAKGERLKAVEEKPRAGRPKLIHGEVEAHIVATACSSPPEGRVRWTLQLIADKVMALTEVESCSHSTVARTLKKMNLSLG